MSFSISIQKVPDLAAIKAKYPKLIKRNQAKK